MHAEIDEVVHIKFKGTLAELLVYINPTLYRKHIFLEKGVPVLYAKLAKSLYGALRAALLFWNNLTKALKDWGFLLNAYDRCVANKTINGHQCTIVWLVDDLKISHIQEQVVHNIVTQLNNKYGKETPLKTTFGKKHKYLGMTFDFEEDGYVTINMKDYVKKILDKIPFEMKGKATTPAATYLFDVNCNCPKLTEDESQFFHYMVAKLLFLCKRG
jgi:Reverse transcriptase (RNA-dependent DNA polymerase)